MIKNYLKIAFRSLLRNKVTGAINIFGLALGMACCFTILMYVTDERNYDRWLPNADQVYRVAIDITNAQGEHLLFAPVSGTLAAALEDYPQVEQSLRLLNPSAEMVPMSSQEDKIFYETGFFWADPNVFEVFQFEFIEGLPTTALEAPNDIVLTREMAEKYFSIKSNFGQLINQTIKKDTTEYRITGIIENIPSNTSFKPGFIASLKEYEGLGFVQNWHATIFQTFVKLKKGTDAAAFEQQIRKIADNYVGEEIKSNQQDYTYFIQPLTSIHLHSDLRYEFSKNNSHTYVQLFGWVALFILLLACINFINLTTAYATKRAKEVGVRKTNGALRSQLIGQFLTETVLISTLAAVIALAMVSFSLPWFNSIADKQFTQSSIWDSQFVWLLPVIIGVSGLLAGFYPAFTLSKFRPATVLRGSFLGKSGSHSHIRNGLVVLQFSISVALIVGVMVLSEQVQYLKNQNLGYNQNQMLVLSAPRSNTLIQNYAAIRTELSKLSGVNQVCMTGKVPGKTFGNNLISLKGDKNKSTDMRLMQIDDKFLDTYGIPIVAGRNLDEKNNEDLSQNILINEAALPFYGWSSPEEALGQTFGGGWGTIVGVVKNFHFNSLHSEVLPLEMYFNQRRFSYVTLNVATSAIDQLLPALKSKWKTLVPGAPFDYAFLDETFDQQYRFEDRLTSLFQVFGGLAIFIACLGLFGLAAFTAEQRTKEIGIRKVLGAGVENVVFLLSRNFLKLIGISFLLATPLALYFLQEWLSGYAYRIELDASYFIIAGIIAVGIAFFTVSFHSLKAAMANPVKSLRSE